MTITIKTKNFIEEMPLEHMSLIIINDRGIIGEGYLESSYTGLWFNEKFYDFDEHDFSNWKWFYKNNLIFV